jgi:hypothetical protein
MEEGVRRCKNIFYIILVHLNPVRRGLLTDSDETFYDYSCFSGIQAYVLMERLLTN